MEPKPVTPNSSIGPLPSSQDNDEKKEGSANSVAKQVIRSHSAEELGLSQLQIPIQTLNSLPPLARKIAESINNNFQVGGENKTLSKEEAIHELRAVFGEQKDAKLTDIEWSNAIQNRAQEKKLEGQEKIYYVALAAILELQLESIKYHKAVSTPGNTKKQELDQKLSKIVDQLQTAIVYRNKELQEKATKTQIDYLKDAIEALNLAKEQEPLDKIISKLHEAANAEEPVAVPMSYENESKFIMDDRVRDVLREVLDLLRTRNQTKEPTPLLLESIDTEIANVGRLVEVLEIEEEYNRQNTWKKFFFRNGVKAATAAYETSKKMAGVGLVAIKAAGNAAAATAAAISGIALNQNLKALDSEDYYAVIDLLNIPKENYTLMLTTLAKHCKAEDEKKAESAFSDWLAQASAASRGASEVKTYLSSWFTAGKGFRERMIALDQKMEELKQEREKHPAESSDYKKHDQDWKKCNVLKLYYEKEQCIVIMQRTIEAITYLATLPSETSKDEIARLDSLFEMLSIRLEALETQEKNPDFALKHDDIIKAFQDEAKKNVSSYFYDQPTTRDLLYRKALAKKGYSILGSVEKGAAKFTELMQQAQEGDIRSAGGQIGYAGKCILEWVQKNPEKASFLVADFGHLKSIVGDEGLFSTCFTRVEWFTLSNAFFKGAQTEKTLEKQIDEDFLEMQALCDMMRFAIPLTGAAKALAQETVVGQITGYFAGNAVGALASAAWGGTYHDFLRHTHSKMSSQEQQSLYPILKGLRDGQQGYIDAHRNLLVATTSGAAVWRFSQTETKSPMQALKGAYDGFKAVLRKRKATLDNWIQGSEEKPNGPFSRFFRFNLSFTLPALSIPGVTMIVAASAIVAFVGANVVTGGLFSVGVGLIALAYFAFKVSNAGADMSNALSLFKKENTEKEHKIRKEIAITRIERGIENETIKNANQEPIKTTLQMDAKEILRKERSAALHDEPLYRYLQKNPLLSKEDAAKTYFAEQERLIYQKLLKDCALKIFEFNANPEAKNEEISSCTKAIAQEKSNLDAKIGSNTPPGVPAGEFQQFAKDFAYSDITEDQLFRIQPEIFTSPAWQAANKV